MPGLITAAALLGLIAAGAALAVLLLVVTAARQALRDLSDRRRERLDGLVRPTLLRAVRSRRIPFEVIQARGRLGRAIDRVTYKYLAQVRGEAHDLLAEVLQRRGNEATTIGMASRWRGNARSRAARRLGLIASPDAVWRLEQLLLDDPSPRVRIVAARALGEVDTPGAAFSLLRSLDAREPGWVPEGIVASALLDLGTSAIPALRHGASEPRNAVRQAMAVDLLGLLKDLPAWEIVARAAESPDPQVRLSAVRAFGQLGMRKATPILIGRLSPGEEPSVRSAAAWALGRLRDPRSAMALKGCLADTGYPVAHNAAQALAALGDTGQQVLTQMAAGDGTAAAHALEALARPAPAPGLRPPVTQPPAIGRPQYRQPRRARAGPR
jgi:HEAT repeat protein